METREYLDSLDDEDIKIRASAIIAMGRTGDGKAVRHLAEILENESEVDWLRACAAIALGRLSAEEAVPPLINALEDESVVISRAVISALGDAGSREAVPRLQAIMKDKQKEELHPVTVSVLGKISGSEIIHTLLRALENANNRVRVSAALALGELRIERAVPSFLKLLEDGDEYLRAVAASSLGLIGDKRAGESLLEALKDEAETVWRLPLLLWAASVMVMPSLPWKRPSVTAVKPCVNRPPRLYPKSGPEKD